jgi:D-glycero-D-manno-heptose 1,7-bisphosphate phosphatase
MKLIILDRDGVINYDSKAYVKSPEEWQPIPGSLEAIAKLTQAGYQIAVATNQSGIARGLFDEAMLRAIHNKMLYCIEEQGGHISRIFFCPHDDRAQCDCRKPKPGLLLQAADYFNCSLEGVPCIGDSYRDLQAAEAVCCQPILVLTGNGKTTLQNHSELLTTINIYEDLSAAVDDILQE